MAWDDEPPTPQEVGTPNQPSNGWDSTPPTEEELGPSKLMSAYRGAANNIPLIPQAIAAGTSLVTGGERPYSQNLEDWNKQAGEAKKANPISYGAGAVGGALAPLAIPGVGEAMEAAPIASNAALGAANALSNKDLTKDLSGTLKEGTEGAVLGGALGKAGEYIGGKLAPAFESAAAKKGLQSTGIGNKFLSEMNPGEYGAAKDYVMANGLVGTNKEEILQKALQQQKEMGEKIGGIGKELDKAGVKASEDEILGAFDKLNAEAAKTETLENPELRKQAIWNKKGANDILNKIGDDPSWKSIQELKQAYGKAAFTDTGEVKNEASKNVYFTLRDMLKNMTEKAKANPNLPAEYKQALAGYHTIHPVIEGLQKAVGAERAGVGGHAAGHGFLPRLIRSLPGQSNPAVNLGTAALATAVSPHLGPLMALPTLTNPAIQSKVFGGAAKAIPGATKTIMPELNDYLTSKFGEKQ